MYIEAKNLDGSKILINTKSISEIVDGGENVIMNNSNLYSIELLGLKLILGESGNER